jgi:hypothetical protein
MVSRPCRRGSHVSRHLRPIHVITLTCDSSLQQPSGFPSRSSRRLPRIRRLRCPPDHTLCCRYLRSPPGYGNWMCHRYSRSSNPSLPSSQQSRCHVPSWPIHHGHGRKPNQCHLPPSHHRSRTPKTSRKIDHHLQHCLVSGEYKVVEGMNFTDSIKGSHPRSLDHIRHSQPHRRRPLLAPPHRPPMRHARRSPSHCLHAPRVAPLAHQQGQVRQSESDPDKVPRQRRRDGFRVLGIQRDQPDARARKGRRIVQWMVRARAHTGEQEEMWTDHRHCDFLPVLWKRTG